jgi:hypothetical protein
MKNIPVTFLALALSIGAPNAASAETTIAGYGATTCASLARDLSVQPEITKFAYLSWAQGFLSGLNRSLFDQAGVTDKQFFAMSATDRIRLLRRLRVVNLYPPSWSIETWFGHLKGYCNAHPSAMFMEAVLDLQNMLAKAELRN